MADRVASISSKSAGLGKTRLGSYGRRSGRHQERRSREHIEAVSSQGEEAKVLDYGEREERSDRAIVQ